MIILGSSQRDEPYTWLYSSPTTPKLMAQTTVHLRTLQAASSAVGWSGTHAITIDRSEEAGGLGIGFNGGELLLLAIGGCYLNDVYREAAKRGIGVRSVQVAVEADWGGDPIRAQNVSFSVKVEAAAPSEAIAELIKDTDVVAEIPNSLRLGTQVSLVKFEAIPV
jgi:uncharacterized OsmC-like protein